MDGHSIKIQRKTTNRPGDYLLRHASLFALCLVCAAIAGLIPFSASAAPSEDETTPKYLLDAVMFIREGYVAEATWLDANQYIYLAVSPDGAAVWRYDYVKSEKERFISANFIEQYLCPAEFTPRLTWVLSPGKRLLFTHYFDDAGQHHWNLLDISGAPDFRLKNFSPPAGMQISRALFSPDDKLGVFFHDAFQDGSDTSVLVLDFEAGTEHWRVNTHALNFITQAWWGAAIYDKPRCNAVAQLYEGEFKEHDGMAKLDLANRTVTFVPETSGVLIGAEALWGEVTCITTGNESQPYEIIGRIPGRDEVRVALTAKPVKVDTLPQAGLVLIANTEDQITTDLWLVNIITGDKWMVDRDCASFSLASDGKLLVRGEKNNALRVYLLSTALESMEDEG